MTNHGTTLSHTSSRAFIWLAYLAAFAGVAGHASSEFVVKLTALQGAEVTVWRFAIGGLALVLVSLARPSTRDLITPLRQDFLPIVLPSSTSRQQIHLL